MNRTHAAFTMATALLVTASATSEARAQAAWVAEKGALDVSLDYNLGVSDKVIADSDLEFPDAGTTAHQITIGTEYVPIPKLAIGLSIPIVALKYTGDQVLYPHPGGGEYDDGKTHTTLTDLRVGTPYQLLDEPLALSPHLGVSIPVADYETVGNTVAGRHLKQLHVGLGI